MSSPNKSEEHHSSESSSFVSLSVVSDSQNNTRSSEGNFQRSQNSVTESQSLLESSLNKSDSAFDELLLVTGYDMAVGENFTHSTSPVTFEECMNEIISNLHKKNEMFRRCRSFLSLARMSLSKDFVEGVQNSAKLTAMFGLMEYNKSCDTDVLLFCKSLLACVLAQHQLSNSDALYMEKILSQYLRATINPSAQTASLCIQNSDVPFCMMPEEIQSMSADLCKCVITPDDIIRLDEVNVSFLCCTSLRNLSGHQYDLVHPNSIRHSTVFLVLEKFRVLIMSPSFNISYNLTSTDESSDFRIMSVQQCLCFFENVLAQNEERQRELLQVNNNVFLKYINRLLAFCLKALFPENSHIAQSLDDVELEKKATVISKNVYLYQTCLISLLKILLTIYRSRNCAVSEIPFSLMEKFIICFIEISYRNLGNKFELSLITLELLVNLTEIQFFSRDQFAKLCLMKFSIGGSTYPSVEILIKVLICTLAKVEVLRRQNEGRELPPADVYLLNNCSSSSFKSVYNIAEEHMEHSFICIFLCVWVSLFCDFKEPFFNYVCERFPSEVAKIAVGVLIKFKEFIPFMAQFGAFGHAYVMLDRAIRVFSRIQKGRP